MKYDIEQIIEYYHNSKQISDELYNGYHALDKIYDGISKEEITEISNFK